MDEITYTPGRLAKKLGISKTTLMRHLRKTGLIDQCVLTRYGHWRIPYNLAVKLSSPSALAVLPPTPVTHKIAKEQPHTSADDNARKRQDVQYYQPDYAQIGRTLQKAGVTMTGLIKYIEQQLGVSHEEYQEEQNHSTKRDKAQTVADPSTRRDESPSTGSTGPDISDSSSEQ